MKIFLCRHGQTTSDVEDRFGGDYEDHLTDEGMVQARSLANKLKDKGIQVIYSSPRVRANETAEIVNSVLKVGTKDLKDIRERNHYGVLTGMVKSEAKEKYPEEYEKVKDYHTNAREGEEYGPFVKRVSSALDEVLNSGYETVAIITHGGPIRVIFREILKLGEVKVEDCGFAEIDGTNGKLQISSLNGIVLETK